MLGELLSPSGVGFTHQVPVAAPLIVSIPNRPQTLPKLPWEETLPPPPQQVKNQYSGEKDIRGVVKK